MKTTYPVLTIRGGIDDDTLAAVARELSEKRGDTLYMVIDSLGGDPSVGYRIMNLLQAKYKKLVAVVPNEAYSTATLMVLGTDEIYMQNSACLGPLDIQMKHPSDGTMISTLEIGEVLNTLAGSVKTFAEDFSVSLKDSSRLGKRDAADLSMRTAVEMVKPIVEKIDPIYLQSSVRTSRIGQKYAEKLLSSRMMKKSPRLARLVSIHLANNYDYHGYAISPKEAAEVLALNVKDVSELALWEDIKADQTNSSGFAVYLSEVSVSNKDASGDTDGDDKKPKSYKKVTASAKLKSRGGK